MTLGDLLELLRESILNDRTDRVSGSSDYLWTDKTLVTFINEAQRKFAVESLILRDGTTDAVTKIALTAGETIYPLHPSVIAVISAKKADQEFDLTRVGRTLFNVFRTPTESWQDPAAYNSISPGPPLAYATDEAMNADSGGTFSQVTLRVFPAPTADQAGQFLRLRVVRKPLVKFVEADITDDTKIPEIPEDHHIEMLDWAAYLALRIVDDDAGAANRADEFAARFTDHVAKAKKLAMMKMFAPSGWGFGGGGFSWGS